MSQEADDILMGRSLVNRHLYQQRIADAAEMQIEQQQPTNYLNFDATTGLARLKSTDGNIVYGAAQTNGAVRVGDNIRLRRGGVFAGYDAMPHKRIDKQNILQTATTSKVKTLFAIFTSNTIDIYIGGDRKLAKKILSIARTGLNTLADYSLVLGGITNLGKSEMVSLWTKTSTNSNFILKKAAKFEQITTNGVFYTYLGNGAWEGSPGVTERSMIYGFNELTLPYQATGNFVYLAVGILLSFSNTEYNTSFSTWTPDRLRTQSSSIKQLISKSVTLNPQGTRIDAAEANFDVTTQGYFLIQNTVNGWITQEFTSNETDYEHLQRFFYLSQSGNPESSLGIDTEQRQYENTNILRYFQNNQDPVVLNNGDFFILNADQQPMVIAENAITKDSTAFTIIYPSTPQSIYYGGYGPSHFATYSEFFETRSVSLQKFDPSNISGNILFNWFVDGKLGLIKGKVSSVLYSATTTELIVSCEISSIIPNTRTSFPKKLISDNGSFYSYFFRNSIGSIANRSILPLLPLSPLLTYNDLLKSALSYISKYDNFVGSRIFSVVQTHNRKANVEQWNISKNGDINFSRIFETDYFPIDTQSTILGHSYYK